MTTILIVGLPSSYTLFLENLQVTRKLDKLTFDELSEMLSQHNKTFGKKKQVGEDVFFTEASTSKSWTDREAGEEDILYKVVVEAKVEKTILQTGAIFKAEEIVKVEGICKAECIFKAEEIVKAEGIFKEEEIVKAEAIFKETIKAEEKLQIEVKTEAEDRIQA